MIEANSRRIEKNLRELALYNATPGQGLTRLSYTKEYRGAADYLRKEMEAVGMAVCTDAIGNLTGRIEGSVPGLPALAVGSHLDSVRHGGIYDGNTGIVCGLELARMLKAGKKPLQHPFEVIAIVEEEGNTFGSGIMGGKAISGMLEPSLLDSLKNEEGRTVRQAMEDFGLRPEYLDTVRRTKYEWAAFIEPHIEQGPVLESEQLSVGVVDTIVGIRTKEIEIVGRSDHGGTTPMHLRKDAVTAMAEVVCMTSRTVRNLEDGTVFTCGSIEAKPGAANVVPGKVTFTLECRSRNQESITLVFGQVAAALESLAGRGFGISEKSLMELAPTHLSKKVVEALKRGMAACGLPVRVLPSGAGHDSMCIAKITETGMIFVPSRDGRSHCPEEFTESTDIATACDVIFAALRELDE